MYSDTGKSQAFLKCLWVNALKQLKHGLVLAICKIKHSVHGLNANNIVATLLHTAKIASL